MSRFIDTELPFLPPGGSLKLVELAPNVQHVQGGGANNLIVAMKDHLVMFDAPYGEAHSRMAIDLAKAKYPGKPIKYLVLTHHHMDHSGGLRTYVAEGATIVVAAPTKAHFDKALRSPRTVANDEQQKARKPLRITEVKDQLTLKDDAGEIRIYNIKNPHAEGYLLGHVVKENVVFVTDLISPRGPVARTDGTLAVGEALKKYGITDSADRRRPRHHRQTGGDRRGARHGGQQPLSTPALLTNIAAPGESRAPCIVSPLSRLNTRTARAGCARPGCGRDRTA